MFSRSFVQEIKLFSLQSTLCFQISKPPDMRFSLQQLSKTLNAVPRIASTSEVATASFVGAEPSPVPQVAGTMDDYVRQMFDGVQALSIFSKNSRPELPSAISTPLNGKQSFFGFPPLCAYTAIVTIGRSYRSLFKSRQRISLGSSKSSTSLAPNSLRSL